MSRNQDSGTITVGQPLIEFEDDAGAFVAAETESVRLPPVVARLPVSDKAAGDVALPSPQQASAAKKVWVPIIRRCTEPVPGAKSHLRPRNAGAPNRGRILIEYERSSGRGQLSGCELDISDKLFLLLLSRDEPRQNIADGAGALDAATPILWTEIVSVRFETERPLAPTASNAQAS
jgi:hypothetical protein